MEIPGAIELNDKAVDLYNLKRYEEALELFDQAIQIDGKNPILHKNKADCLYDAGDVDRSFQSYRTALALDKNKTPIINLDFALLLIKQQNLIEALEQLIRVKLNPKTPPNEKIFAYKYLAAIYLEIKEYTRAKAAILESMKEFPELTDDYNLTLNLVHLYGTEHECGKQMKIIDMWLQKYPEKPDAIKTAIEFYRTHMMLGKTKRLLEKTKPLIITNLGLAQQIALTILECNDYKFLIKFLEDLKSNAGAQAQKEFVEFIDKSLAAWLPGIETMKKVIEKDQTHENDVPLSKRISTAILRIGFCIFLKQYKESAQIFVDTIPQDVNHPLVLKISYYLHVLGGNYSSAIEIMATINENTLGWLEYFLNAYCNFKLDNREAVYEKWLKVLELNLNSLFSEIDPFRYFSEPEIEEDIFGFITSKFKQETNFNFP